MSLMKKKLQVLDHKNKGQRTSNFGNSLRILGSGKVLLSCFHSVPA